jgi:ABC-type multidrug transport system ATPase subunit
MGMKALDQGQIRVLGEILKPNKLPKACLQIGFMPQENSLHDEMSVDETMTFFGCLYHMKTDKLEERKKFLKDLLELPPDHQLVRECSGGQQRRISLSIALLHEPKLLILDEPTVGLDPLLREKIWTHLVHSTRSKQLSIIITTHYIEEAVQADRCGLMRNGVLLDEDAPRLIMERNKCDTLEEAFLKLCVKKNHNERKTYDPSEIEMNQLNNVQVYGEKSEVIEFDITKRKLFRFKTMKALIYKNYLQNIRHPL